MSKLECKRCLYKEDHALGLVIDDEGICSGCRVHEEKDVLDWPERWQILEKMTKGYKSNNKSNYDCIIPVSGGMDSYYIVHLVKVKLGMTPLLVTYNKYWNTPLGIRNLANLRIKFDCDILIQNVNPHSVKKIVKTTLRRFGSIYWHCIAGQTVFPVQTAVRYKIPLIIWGAHQGMEQVGMYSHLHEVEMTRRYRKDHDLMGYEADDLLSNFDTLSENDIWQYRYPDDKSLNSVGVRGVYLNNYVRWDPKQQHEDMINLYDYETSSFRRTFDYYDFVDCYNYMNFHDKLKVIKHGYGKVLDHACREIRHGRLSKQQGQELVSYHFEQAPQHESLLAEWLGVSQKSLDFVADLHRNPDYWEKQYPEGWRYRGDRTLHQKIEHDLSFVDNSSMNRGKAEQYITIGKGWP